MERLQAGQLLLARRGGLQLHNSSFKQLRVNMRRIADSWAEDYAVTRAPAYADRHQLRWLQGSTEPYCEMG